MIDAHDPAARSYELHYAALVLLVDQIEDAVPDGQTVTRIQQAFDSLRAIADAVPSAVVVVSCLEDVYDTIAPKLARALRDRIEHDPPPVRLSSGREVDESNRCSYAGSSLYNMPTFPGADDRCSVHAGADQCRRQAARLRLPREISRYHNACTRRVDHRVCGRHDRRAATPPPRLRSRPTVGSTSEQRYAPETEPTMMTASSSSSRLRLWLEFEPTRHRPAPRRAGHRDRGRAASHREHLQRSRPGNHPGASSRASLGANAGVIPIAIAARMAVQPKQTRATRREFASRWSHDRHRGARAARDRRLGRDGSWHRPSASGDTRKPLSQPGASRAARSRPRRHRGSTGASSDAGAGITTHAPPTPTPRATASARRSSRAADQIRLAR
jgi:hypothetical protein